MSAPDAVPGFESITPPDSVWVNAISARAGLQILRYRPGTRRQADRVPDPGLRLRPRLARGPRGVRSGRAGRAAGRGRALPDRALRDLHRRVVRARRVTPDRVPGAPPQRMTQRLRTRVGCRARRRAVPLEARAARPARPARATSGASLFEVPPGGATFPLHAHFANEELLVVLSGRPTLTTREDARELAARPRSVALPAGLEGAHRLDNATDEARARADRLDDARAGDQRDARGRQVLAARLRSRAPTPPEGAFDVWTTSD